MDKFTRDRPLPTIEIVVPETGARLWQKMVVERLRAAGHDTGVLHGPDAKWPLAARMAVEFERRLFRRADPGLTSPVSIEEAPANGPATLRLDLTGAAPRDGRPTLRLVFDGSLSDSAILATTAAGRLPDIEAVLDGKIVARAAPMIDKRESAVLGAEELVEELDAGRPLLAQDLGLRLPPMGDGLGQAELLDPRRLPPAINGSFLGAAEVIPDRPLGDAQDSRRLALRLVALVQNIDRHDLLPCELCQGVASERAWDVQDQLESP